MAGRGPASAASFFPLRGRLPAEAPRPPGVRIPTAARWRDLFPDGPMRLLWVHQVVLSMPTVVLQHVLTAERFTD